MPRASWQIFLISPDITFTSALLPLLTSGLPGATVVQLDGYPSSRNLADLQKSAQSVICFLDVASDSTHAISAITSLLAAKPDIRIAILLKHADPNVILQCLRNGAAEFLTWPFSPDQVQEVLERLCQFDREAHKLGRVTTVIPAKGACGATTIATNLAIHYKRQSKGPVLLADLDPITGTVSFQFKLKSTYSFLDALLHMDTLDADIWKGLTVQSQGIDILLPPASAAAGADPAKDAGPLIDFTRDIYDHVVLDVGSIYGDWTVSIAHKSDDILVVSTSELPALQSAMRGLGYLEACGIPRDKIKLLINRYSPGTGLTKEMIEAALHTEVYHLIPSDYETVQRALMAGKVIPTATVCGKSLLALAEKLLGPKAEKKDDPPPKKAVSGGVLESLGNLLRSFTQKRR